MYRRALLSSFSAVSVASVAGCLSTLDSPNTGSPTATKQKETAGLSATVTSVSYDGTAGENEESVSLSGDCTAQSATLGGWFSTSSCRTVAIRALQYNSTERYAELVLYPHWTNSDPPESVDCAGASYQYQVELTAQENLPTDIQVVYERPDDRASTDFSVQLSECS